MKVLQFFVAAGFLYYSTTQAGKVPGKGNPDETSGFFEGDIIKGKHRMTSSNLTLKWPSNVIPYTIDAAYDNDSGQFLFAAMAEIEEHSCLVFSRLDENATDQWPDDYLMFQNLTGCASSIGRQGGPQTISIQIPDCAYKGIAMHEILHALGFFHEHNRPDRDKYIRINWTNIDPHLANHFQAYSDDEVELFGEPYDYSSLLHGSSVFLAADPQYSTLIPYPDDTVTIGQRSSLSDSDIRRLSAAYCQPEAVTTTAASETTTSISVVCNGTTQYIPHPTDCSKFYVCQLHNPTLQSCPANLLFNPELNVCDWERNVNCTTATM